MPNTVGDPMVLGEFWQDDDGASWLLFSFYVRGDAWRGLAARVPDGQAPEAFGLGWTVDPARCRLLTGGLRSV